MAGGWLPRGAPAPWQVDLLCLPYAGGGASAYRGWDVALGPDVCVRPGQPPGHESRMREPLEVRLAPLVSSLREAVSRDLRPPFVVFGHSMGALLAFELARALRAEGDAEPALLVVSGYRAPHLPDVDEPVHTLDDRGLRARLGEMAGTPAEVLQDDALCELILPIVRADFEVCETYAYEPAAPLDMPIVVYRGEDDHRVPERAAQQWSEHTTRSCTVRSFPGDHFFVRSARAQVLTDLRTRCHTLVGAAAGRPG